MCFLCLTGLPYSGILSIVRGKQGKPKEGTMTRREQINDIISDGLIKAYEFPIVELDLKGRQMLHKKVTKMVNKLGYEMKFPYPIETVAS